MKMPYRCAAPGCSNLQRPGFSLHAFPKDKERNKKWRVNMGRVKSRQDPRLWESSKHSRLCQDHFTKDCYIVSREQSSELGFVPGKFILKDDAIPTLFKHSKPTATIRGAYKKRQKQEVDSFYADFNRFGNLISNNMRLSCISLWVRRCFAPRYSHR